MEYRHGKCSACGAEYKIPASFSHDVAKCKECGGVVHVGPVQGGSQPIPARKLAEKKDGGGAPAKKKGGTLERLKAERAAAAEPSAPAKKKSGTLERLKAERAEAAAKPQAKAGAKTAAKREPVGATAGVVARGGAPRGGTRRGASAARRRSRKRGEDGEEGDEPRGRRPKKKGPPVLLIGVIAIVIMGGAFGAWYFLGDSDSGTQAAETDTTAQAPDADAEATDGAADEAPPAEDGAGDDGGDEAPAEEAPAEEEPKPEPKPKKKGDPASVDLTALNELGRARGTDDAEWADLNEKMKLFLADDGARSNRALNALEKTGRKAVPVIINHMAKLDFASEDGYRFGDNCQRTLQKICNGNNFGWKYSTEPEDVYYNKKVVTFWHKSWTQVEEDVEAWIKLAKLDDKDEKEAQRLRELYGDGVSQEVQDELDDLDVD